jgi:hypothetical protein
MVTVKRRMPDSFAAGSSGDAPVAGAPIHALSSRHAMRTFVTRSINAMRVTVQICCLLGLLAAAAPAQYPPPGLVQWGSQAYTLDAGESISFQVDFEQIPVRRWLLLVEGDLKVSHLNLRRPRDGSLIYDEHNESRHAVEIPWGVGESLSGVLTAGLGGGYAISIWGPPRDDYLRAYGYEVNRALEALADEDRDRARSHLLSALRDDPSDAVATTLLQALTDGSVGTVVVVMPDSTASRRLAEVRAAAADLRAAGQPYAAADTLQGALGEPLGRAGLARIYGDLADVFLDLGNVGQATDAIAAAEALDLEPDEVARLRDRLTSLE